MVNHRVRVKIEGLRSGDDARRVAMLGADAVGLVFAPSPRQVSLQQAREVVAAVGPWVATVGLFVNAPVDEINEIVDATGIDYVQLHGDEPPHCAGQIRAKVIKAFRVRDEQWLSEVSRWLSGLDAQGRRRFSAVLLDAFDSSARGGTGQKFNWDLVADARNRGDLRDLGPIILAGGLDPSCVADAIRTIAPWGVDVASGVESAPGVKDFQKVEAFIRVAGNGI